MKNTSMCSSMFFAIILCIVLSFVSCSMPSDYYPPELEAPPAIYSTMSSQIEVFESDDYNFGTGESLFFWGDEDSMVFKIDNDVIRLMPIDLSVYETLYRLPQELSDFLYPAISPDRKSLVFTSFATDSYDLFLLNLNSFELTQLTQTPDVDERFPRFSGDNSRIVYATDRGSFDTISILDLETSSVDTVVSHREHSGRTVQLRCPAFCENDARIFYATGTVDSLITVNPDGTDRQVLEHDGGFLSDIAISEDGSRVVYTRDGSPEIVATIKTDGTGYHEIVDGFGTSGDGFSISDDGGKILFWMPDKYGGRDEYKKLYSINSDGTDLKFLSHGRDGRYSSDRSSIVFKLIREKM